MIISKQKPLSEILELLKGASLVSIIGCGTCATHCRTGGEGEVREMGVRLRECQKSLIEEFVIESVCASEKTKKELKKRKTSLQRCDALLVMACGVGAQVVAAMIVKPVYPALDTLFIGSWRAHGPYEEMCSLCGDCLLGLTGGICPITRCSKGLMNGPCGGAREGRCEVDPQRDCGWLLIYERLKAQGNLEFLEKMWGPCDFSKSGHPQRVPSSRSSRLKAQSSKDK